MRTIKKYTKLLFFMYLHSPNLGIASPGTFIPNAHGSDACRGAIVHGPEH